MGEIVNKGTFFFANNKGTFGNKKKNEAYDDRRKVPPVTAVISVARCRAFNHRTRAFPYVKHGQPRRQVPQTGRALSGARHSSTVHRPAVHTCMCRWLPRRRHRPDAAETLPKSSGLVPRHPHGHQTMLAAVVGSSRNLLANLGTPDNAVPDLDSERKERSG